jgi:hypothetical protein
MQDQPSAADVGVADDEIERVVLALLLEPGSRGPWSVWELGLGVGSELRVAEAVVRLHAAGLVHRVDEFVWVTRPLARFYELLGRA